MVKESVVTPQRFASGKTYEEYINSIQKNVERFKANYEQTELSDDDRRALSRLGASEDGPARALILGEDWCPDVYRGLPVIVRVAEALGSEIRIFERDQNLDIMDEFLKQGQFQSIPTVVFYTRDHRYIAHWIERPKLADEEHHLVDEIFAEGKPREQQRAEYAELQAGPKWASWRQETVRELRELLEQKLG
jgi:hypothetical protein